jgi:uncharacterized protein
MFDPNEKAPEPPLNPSADDMLEICKRCGGVCCTYVATEIDEPTEAGDFENIRWYCTHKDIWVFKDEGDWYLAFNSSCEFLGVNAACTIYERRPDVCRNHKFGECDYYLRGKFELELHTLDEVDAYIREHYPSYFRKKNLKKRQRKPSALAREAGK